MDVATIMARYASFEGLRCWARPPGAGGVLGAAQAALCALTFGESTVPGPLRDGRPLPYPTFIAYLVLMLLLPLSTILLVPLLALRRSPRGGEPSRPRRVTSWIVAVGAGTAVDILLWISVAGYLTPESFGSLRPMDWGALCLSIAFLAIGIGMMALVLARARAAPADSPAA